MSSPDPARATRPGGPGTAHGDTVGKLPPALRSMWRLCLLGFRYEPALMGVSFALALVAAVPDALLAVWFKLLGEGLLEHKPALLRFAVIALAVSAVATWLLATVSTRIQRRFRDKVTIALESHVARLQAGIATIAHQERPEYLDRLSVLREETYTLDHMYMSVFSTAGWLVRLGITLALLGSVNPVLLTLVLFAIPTVAATSWRPVVERSAQERGAQSTRLAAHLYDAVHHRIAGKELRVLGIGPALAGRRRAAWELWYGPVATARSQSAAWYAGGWAVFALGYVGAIALTAAGPRASVSGGDPGADRGRPAVFLPQRHGRRDRLPARHLDGRGAAARLARGLRARRGAARRPARAGAHQRGHQARARHVPLPGRQPPRARRREPVPARRVGGRGRRRERRGQEHAGQAARQALLPHHGPHPGGRHGPGPRRQRTLAGAAGRGVPGLLPFRVPGGAHHRHRRPAAARRSSPRWSPRPSGRGPGTSSTPCRPACAPSSGRPGTDGVDVSYGQWQKLALARGFMRDEPLLTALDEPTAALDAETEHQLFERYAATAHQARANGGVTILVSHRFSTVRMADLIVVLDGAHVAEAGSHDELLARGGRYAELYRIQAAGYQ